jgi:hypothetical protein
MSANFRPITAQGQAGIDTLWNVVVAMVNEETYAGCSPHDRMRMAYCRAQRLGASRRLLIAQTSMLRGSAAAAEKAKPSKVSNRRILDKALAAAAENRRPNVDECDDYAVVAVRDPSEAEALVRVGKGPPMRVGNPKAVMRWRVASVRSDPARQLLNQYQRSHPSQEPIWREAVMQWEAVYESCEIGNLRAVDPALDRVDGGALFEPAVRVDALKKLAEVDAALGNKCARLVRLVLGEKRTLREVAESDGKLAGSPSSADKALDHYGRSFQECLDTLAEEFGLIQKGRGPRRPSDRFDDLARHSQSPALHEAVQRAERES